MKPMARAVPIVVAALLVPTVSAAKETCEHQTRIALQIALDTSNFQPSLQAYLSRKLARPRYFEGDPKTGCSEWRTDASLYAGIPVRECTYTELGFPGWVVLAEIKPELAARWIADACAGFRDRKTCAVRTTTYAWCSNQLSYPVVGNIVEPRSAGGGKGDTGRNYFFLHGVTINPAGLGADAPLDVATQRTQLNPLASSSTAYTGEVAQVSRPAGVRREIYWSYAPHFEAGGKSFDPGKSCPMRARRREWLDISRAAFIEGYRTGRHRLFKAAAKALMNGEFPGRLDCPK